VVDIPETRYTKTADEVHIAYQVLGDGPFDLVLVTGYVSHLELAWDDPEIADFLRALSSFSRLILFDRRGLGLSDPVQGAPTIEDRMQDLRAVMDAAGSERAALFGVSEGGPMSMVFAATYPERVSALVLYGTFARMTEAEGYPWGYPFDVFEQFVASKIASWGGDETVDAFAPSRAQDAEFRRRWAAFERRSTSPGSYRSLMHMNADTDVRDVLPSIRVPTLVLHRSGDIPIRVGNGRYLSEHIAGARFVELPGEDHFYFVGDTGALLEEAEEFLTGRRSVHERDRVLATVLFTDIVGSTEEATRLGDMAWRRLLDQHDMLTRREVDRWRGRVVKSTGDGALATFDGPARAIRCAAGLQAALQGEVVRIRAGLHTGEIELRADDIGGIGVHIAARVEALAEPDEVLVTKTVTDLVAGSGISFADRGLHDLKGVPGSWQLFAVAGT
jgi:class 3 adenylate cyclase/alpha-beta hydrolase superfamily lysophospholipase